MGAKLEIGEVADQLERVGCVKRFGGTSLSKANGVDWVLITPFAAQGVPSNAGDGAFHAPSVASP